MFLALVNYSRVCIFKSLFSNQAYTWISNMMISVMSFEGCPIWLYLVSNLAHIFYAPNLIIIWVELIIIFRFYITNICGLFIKSYIINIKINICFWSVNLDIIGMLLNYMFSRSEIDLFNTYPLISFFS